AGARLPVPGRAGPGGTAGAGRENQRGRRHAAQHHRVGRDADRDAARPRLVTTVDNTVDIAVPGLGLVTAAGGGVEASWRGVCAGASTAATDPELAGLPVDFSCRVPGF